LLNARVIRSCSCCLALEASYSASSDLHLARRTQERPWQHITDADDRENERTEPVAAAFCTLLDSKSIQLATVNSCASAVQPPYQSLVADLQHTALGFEGMPADDTQSAVLALRIPAWLKADNSRAEVLYRCSATLSSPPTSLQPPAGAVTNQHDPPPYRQDRAVQTQLTRSKRTCWRLHVSACKFCTRKDSLPSSKRALSMAADNSVLTFAASPFRTDTSCCRLARSFSEVPTTRTSPPVKQCYLGTTR
jgi:hypothetical protein